MTEIDRIKKEGWLPDSFWNEEVDCGYTVSKDLKKVWAVELDLFREFVRVCELHGLGYFAIGGTLLGAVRHGGFIPWDDDLDVVMPRKDYEKLKTLTGEFRQPYFLQSPDTDPEYGYSFLKLRNSETACIVDKFKHCKFNHGLFLDIFPLDYASDENLEPRYSKIADLIMINSARMRKECPNLNNRDKDIISRYYDEGRSTADVFHEIESVAGMAEDESDSPYQTVLVCTIFPPEKKKWLRKSFEDYILMDFEGLKMRAPVGWDQILTANFGDWRQLPPVEKRGLWHVADFRAEQSYREVLGTEDESGIMVSIICCAYNHGRYIRQCLEGFVMQKTDFKFEAIVHDDASSDDTADIIREFERKRPDIVKPIYQTENQYSTGIGILKTYIYPRVRGKYIAICEGDDFWIDPLKLQKQVDFMESHPECPMCCTNIYRMTDRTGEKWCRFYKNRTVTLNELLYERNRIATLSILMRTDLTMEYRRQNELMPGWPMGDMPMWIWMAYKGSIGRLPDITGTYRILEESVSHTKDKDRRFFFRLAGYEIRLYMCNLMRKFSLSVWIERDFFIIKSVLRDFSGHKDKLKYLFRCRWSVKPAESLKKNISKN